MESTAAVTAVDEVGPSTVAVTLETPAGFDARPGQFVRLGADVDGESYARFYTLSSPDADGTFEVTVGIDPEEGGPFSRFLAELAPGDELTVAGPFGDAAYDGEARPVVLAGGPGIGAAVGIAERALAEGHDAAIVYRPDADGEAHGDRLATLGERGATIRVVDAGDPIADAVADVLAVPGTAFVYGFRAFVDDALAAIEAAGGDPDAAKVESFG